MGQYPVGNHPNWLELLSKFCNKFEASPTPMLPKYPSYLVARVHVDNSIRALVAARRHKVAEHQTHMRALAAAGKKVPNRKPWIIERFDMRLRKLRALADRLFIEQVKNPKKKKAAIHKDLRETVNAPLRGLI